MYNEYITLKSCFLTFNLRSHHWNVVTEARVKKKYEQHRRKPDRQGKEWWCLDRWGEDDNGTTNKNTRWINSWRRKVAGKRKNIVKDKGQLKSSGWKAPFNEGWTGASHGWRDERERKEAQQKSLFYITVISDVKMSDKAQCYKDLLKICCSGAASDT